MQTHLPLMKASMLKESTRWPRRICSRRRMTSKVAGLGSVMTAEGVRLSSSTAQYVSRLPSVMLEGENFLSLPRVWLAVAVAPRAKFLAYSLSRNSLNSIRDLTSAGSSFPVLSAATFRMRLAPRPTESNQTCISSSGDLTREDCPWCQNQPEWLMVVSPSAGTQRSPPRLPVPPPPPFSPTVLQWG